MDKYLYVAKDGYRYVAGSVWESRESRMLAGMGAKPVGYAALADTPDRGMFAILRTSGKFSLSPSLLPEPELDRALATNEDEMHIWSSGPADAPKPGDSMLVAAVMRNYLQNGGSRETLHALADSL